MLPTASAIRSVALSLAIFSGCSGSESVSVVTASEITEAAEPITVNSGDWPNWRGFHGDGVSRGPATPAEWAPETNIRWATPVEGRGHASPIIHSGRVYLASADEQAQEQFLLAFDTDSGEQLWKTVIHQGGFPDKGMHAKSTHANSTPACDGHRIITAFLNGKEIHASAVSLDGDILWQTPLGSFELDFGFAASPWLFEDLALFSADNKGSGFIAAVHRKTGELVWRQPRHSLTSYASPVVVTIADRQQLLLSGNSHISSYDPRTGELLWSVPAATPATCGSIVWDGNLVFISGGFPGKETACVDALTQQLVWKNDVRNYEQSLITLNHRLYSFSDNGILYCWETATGKELWKQRLGGSVSSSLVACSGLVYATNERGTTWVFKDSPDRFELISENQLGEEGFATPSIAGGRLFIRTATGSGPRRQETLYCIEAP